jgi:hypothetical protein
VTPPNEHEKKDAPSEAANSQANTSPVETPRRCDRWTVVHTDCFDIWRLNENPSQDARDQADEWLLVAGRLGPLALDHATRTDLGQEEHAARFDDDDLVIVFRVLPESCEVSIIDVRTLAQDAKRRGLRAVE